MHFIAKARIVFCPQLRNRKQFQRDLLQKKERLLPCLPHHCQWEKGTLLYLATYPYQ